VRGGGRIHSTVEMWSAFQEEVFHGTVGKMGANGEHRALRT